MIIWFYFVALTPFLELKIKVIILNADCKMPDVQLTNSVCACVCVFLWLGVCHSVPVSEIISVREEEEENGSRQRDDGSWKKIKEGDGKDCRQAFTGKQA